MLTFCSYCGYLHEESTTLFKLCNPNNKVTYYCGHCQRSLKARDLNIGSPHCETGQQLSPQFIGPGSSPWQRLLEQAQQELGVELMGLATCTGEDYTLRWQQIMGNGSAAYRSILLAPGQGLAGLTLAWQRYLQVANFQALEPAYRANYPIVEAEGIQAAALVPVCSGGYPAGALLMANRRVTHFSLKATRMLAQWAYQAGQLLEPRLNTRPGTPL